MWGCRRCPMPVLAGLIAGELATTALAQETGTIRGTVTFTASGEPVHGAVAGRFNFGDQQAVCEGRDNRDRDQQGKADGDRDRDADVAEQLSDLQIHRQ